MADPKLIPALLRLGLPTMLVLLVQAGVGVAETWFVSFLGTTALTAAAVVFPAYMLMAMMANGGIGGGVSSAIARALGAGDRDRAESLAFHGLVVAVAFGAIFTLALWLGGAALYRAMGADDAALSSALAYSHVLFAGAIPLWITALLSSALRGAGEVRAPARITLAGAVVLLLLSPALIFGFGPLPRLEMAGAGVAMCVYFTLAALALVLFMRSRASPLRLRAHRLEWRNARDILSVGLLSAVGTVQANLTVALVTAAVGQYAADAIAGYGIGSRLDYLLIPLLFGFGTGVVTLVGREVGAGNHERALRIAWTGAALAGATTGVIGIAAAIFAPAWAGLFTRDPAVIATTALYLRTVAPFYAIFGFAMTLYFAGQGARRVGWPIVAGTVRLLVAGVLGTVAASVFHWPLSAVFALVAASTVLFGAITVGALIFRPWGGRVAVGPSAHAGREVDVPAPVERIHAGSPEIHRALQES